MSSKKESTSTINYDQGAKSAYDTNIATAMPVLQGYAQNPFSNQFFQQNLGMMNKQATQAGQNNVSNLMNNSKQGGFGNMSASPFLQAQLARAGRATSGMQQQGRFNAMSQANQQQMQSLGMLSSFQPLMTGQQTTEKTSGTGTWLPQVLGAAAQGALAFGTGGASLAAKGAMSAVGAGANAASQAFGGGSYGGGGIGSSMWNPMNSGMGGLGPNYGASGLNLPPNPFTTMSL